MSVQNVQPIWHTGEHAVRTPYGIVLPPGGRIAAYVRSTGVQDYDPPEVAENLKATLAAALPACRPNMGDTILCLPGHNETVTSATALAGLRPGTRIVGALDPRQENAPKFTWANIAGQWAIDQANVSIEGLRVIAADANGITKAINVTGSGFRFGGNLFTVALGATQKAAIAMEIGAGAWDASIVGNWVTGTETHNVTNCILVTDASAVDLVITDNVMLASATAANGLINITAAIKRFFIARNTIFNTHTASTAAITVGAVAAEGVFESNRLAVKNTGAITSLTHGFNVNAACIAAFFENRVANDPRVTGIVSPTADT